MFHAFISGIDSGPFLYGGIIGIGAGIIFLLIFLFNRIRWMLSRVTGKNVQTAGILASLRNLLMIFLWTAIFGVILFVGFFLQAYSAFTAEKPVAEVHTHSIDSPQTSRITFIQYLSPDSQLTRQYLIHGDQWMLEGDIVKWDNWLNFLGLETRYRFTRLRGRYLSTEEEISRSPSIYSLVPREKDPFWGFLYRYGYQFPFISTVYGNAVFQLNGSNKNYMVYVSTSGFVVREKQEAGRKAP